MSEMRFLYSPITRNFTDRGKNPEIKYIVIHDTGNTGVGANALNHKNYMQNNKRGASAHYFVDDIGIVQFVGDSKSAGAVGDGHGRYGIRNQNSISIEMCINSDGNYAKTYKNTVELTKNLMKKFNIPIDRVVRHYDASRKSCPNHMRKDNWKAWWQFKEEIKKPIEWNIDLSKNSKFGGSNSLTKEENKKDNNSVKINFLGKDLSVNGKNIDGSNYVAIRDLFEKLGYEVDWKNETVIVSEKKTNSVNKKPTNQPKETSKYFKGNGLDFIETSADNIEIKKVLNQSLSNSKNNGINGTFYATGKPYIYGIAMQDGRPIDTNSFVTTFNGTKRGTIWYDNKRLYVGRVCNTKQEIKTLIKWAVSGLMLYPYYDPAREGFTGKYADVLRKCNHTAIGYKGKTVYLIVGKDLTLLDFRNKILNSKVAFDGLIALDGGGSSQMRFDGKDIMKSTRPLNHCISLIK